MQLKDLQSGKVYWGNHGTLVKSWLFRYNNYIFPTPEELAWFEHCEREEKYISFEDFKKLVLSPQIQLYPL